MAIRCWIIESIMSEYCCSICTTMGFDSPVGVAAVGVVTPVTGFSPSLRLPPDPAANCSDLRFWMTGVTQDDRYCSSSVRSRSERFDSVSEAPDPPARRRCSVSSWSTEALSDSMANSHEARDKTLCVSAGDEGRTRTAGVEAGGVTGLLNRLRRAGFAALGEEEKMADARLLLLGVVLATLFSKLRTRALTLLRNSAVSSELDESLSACWMSPVETAEEIRRICNDLVGVEPLPVALGAALLAELMVGRMADGVREMELAEGDLDTPKIPLEE